MGVLHANAEGFYTRIDEIETENDLFCSSAGAVTLRQRLPQAQHSPAQRDLSRKFHDSLLTSGTPLDEIEHSERFEPEIAAREARLQRAGALTNDPNQLELQMTAHIKQLEQQNELLRLSAAADQLRDASLTNDPNQLELQMTAHIKRLEQQNELLRVSPAADQHLDSSHRGRRGAR